MTPNTLTPTRRDPGAAEPDAPPRLPGISVILPCFNEAGNVEAVTRAALSACPRVAEAWEVIIVDDGSSDGTTSEALALVRSEPEVRLLRHNRNRGYGAALRTGIEAATQPWTFMTDADGQFDLSEMERLLEPAQDHDLVIGYRASRSDNLLRRINGSLWTRLMAISLGLAVRDVDCAFKLVRTDLAQGLPLTADGAMFSAELLARARHEGARLAEIPVTHLPRNEGSPTGAKPAVILRAFREFLTLRRTLAHR